MQESQLIGHVSLNIEDNIEESSSPVRIISPKEVCGKDITDNNLDFNAMKSLDIQDVRFYVERQGDSLGDREIEDLQQSLNTSCLDEDKKASILTEMSSYGALMEHIDQKLSEIEVELITALKAQTYCWMGMRSQIIQGGNKRWSSLRASTRLDRGTHLYLPKHQTYCSVEELDISTIVPCGAFGCIINLSILCSEVKKIVM